ncbi:TPM domain-containing protein [Ascidiimonas aurantiaca]|uniref:TPM domain-containing protein n=1 Tax=Ascidiimonas aurantiaca TaxID=1685432 RepID=UPI0030EE8649
MKILYKALFLVAVLFYSAGVSAQFTIPEKPTLQTSVYDYINLLNPAQKKNLESKLIHYSDSTSTQIVIAIIASTEGENINYLGAQWGQKWGIGQNKKDNGVLILLAKNDRKIAISTGYGTEATLTDALSKRIITNVIIPQFKNGNYYQGLDSGTDAVFKVLTGEFKAQGQQKKGAPGNFVFMVVFLFVIIIIILSRIKGGKGGGHGRSRHGGSLTDIIILSNMGRGSWGSSGGFGSGGGFSGGFGGGGFGGGGASGGW